MEKKIVIQGKNNVDKIHHKDKKKIKRKVVLETNAWKDIESENVEKLDNHILWIEKLKENEEFPERKALVRDLKSKLNSYKHQDIEKKKYDEVNFMTIEKLIDLLLDSNLLCYYCRNPMYILYEQVRQSSQWTLDRINNDLGHLCENCFIACLRCNVQRKRMNDDKFKFSKQIQIHKVGGDEDNIDDECQEDKDYTNTNLEGQESDNENTIKKIIII